MTDSHVAGASSRAQPEDGPLPKDEWQYWLIQGDQIVLAHYVKNGHLGHSLFALRDLPNDLISTEDLEALGISTARFEDGSFVFKLELCPRHPPG